MNIWIVNHYAAAPGGRSGSRHASLGRELVKLGHDVTIVAASFDHFDRKQRGSRSRPIEVHDGVRFVWLRTPSYFRNDYRRMANVIAFFLGVVQFSQEKSVPAPDVIVGSSFHPLAALGAWWRARRARVPFVFEVRDLWPRTGVDLGFMNARSPLTQALYAVESFLAHRAARIIVLLPGGVDYFRERYGPAVSRRVQWIPNGADVARFAAVPPPTQHSHFTAMYLGAHGRPNELDQLLDAAVELRKRARQDIRFVLVGDGTERERLRSRAAAEGLTTVEFRPSVDKRRIPEVVREAHAFLIPISDSPLYRYGISANKVFEYLSAGRPTVICYSGGYDPIAEANAGVSVRPNDAGALADALIRLADADLSEIRAIGERARVWVARNHDYAVLGGRFARVMAAAVSRVSGLAAEGDPEGARCAADGRNPDLGLVD